MSASGAGLRLTRLALSDFRNHARLAWHPGGAADARIAAIFGPNGGGKTNILEAVSLLGAGRGLRLARRADLARRDGPGGFAVAGRFAGIEGDFTVATGVPAPGAIPDGAAPGAAPGAARGVEPRRVFRLDGAAPESQGHIAARVALAWLTPPMERLFQEGASGRRRFLDRLVAALEAGHGRELAAHERALAARARLLRSGGADPAWLAAIEDAIARHAVAVTAARAGVLRRLNQALARVTPAGFPPARADLLCPIAARLGQSPALAVEDWLRARLHEGRGADRASGQNGFGAHRADFALHDAARDLPAAQASTGEQKALLIGVILGHAALVARVRGFAPILLLDEPMVHLDTDRRAALIAAVAELPAQIFLTGTDRELFLPLAGAATGWHCGGGRLTADPAFLAAVDAHACSAPVGSPSGFCAPRGL